LRDETIENETEVFDDNFDESDGSDDDDDEEFYLNENNNAILTSVRRIVVLFRRSSLKPDNLHLKIQEKNAAIALIDVDVIEGDNKTQNKLLDDKVKLQLDVKTRWNTYGQNFYSLLRTH